MRRMVMVGLFVVAWARPTAAEVLTISSVHVDSGTVVVRYNDIMEVLYDSLALSASPCVGSPTALGCDAVAFAGGMWGSSYTFVRPLLAPITAVSYAVSGTFALGGTIYAETAPRTFAFSFETPTLQLALPLYTPVPALQPGSPLPWQSTFIVRAIDVTRAEAVPEPGVWLLLGLGMLSLVRRRRP